MKLRKSVPIRYGITAVNMVLDLVKTQLSHEGGGVLGL